MPSGLLFSSSACSCAGVEILVEFSSFFLFCPWMPSLMGHVTQLSNGFLSLWLQALLCCGGDGGADAARSVRLNATSRVRMPWTH